MALLALIIRIILSQRGLNYDPWSYRFFPAEMFFFLLGVLSYKLYAATKKIEISNSILGLSFLITLSSILAFDMLLLQFHKYFYFLGLALAIPFVFRFTQKSKWDRIVGEYSYPVYIAHVFFKGLYFMLFGFSENISIAVILASILFASLYNQFINPKFENYRQQRVLAN